MSFNVSMLITANAEQAKRELKGAATDVQAVGAAGRAAGASVAEGMKVAEAQIATLTREIGTLRSRLDAAAAAERQTVAQMVALQTKVNELEAAFGRGRGPGAGGANGAVGNLIYQFNDVGTMLAAGQSPLLLAVQQGPQITQALGPAGAAGSVRLLGQAFLGMLSPVNFAVFASIAGLGLMGDALRGLMGETKSVEDNLTDLKNATDAYMSAAKASKATVADLRLEYADLSDEVKRALDIQTELTRRAQERAQTLTAGGVASAVTGNLPGLLTPSAVDASIKGYDALIEKRDQLAMAYRNALVDPDSADGGAALGLELSKVEAAIAVLDGVKSRLEELKAQYGLTTDEAQRLTDAAAALNQADTGRAQVEAASQLQSALIDIFGSAEAVDQKFAGVLGTLQAIVVEGAKAAQQTDDAGLFAGIYRDALDQASGILDGMAGKYGPIIANIEAAAKAAWNLAQASAAAVPAGSLDDAGNPTEFGLGSAARRPPRRPPTNIDFGYKAASAGASARQEEASKRLVATLERELDLLRETDPVQKEMIRNREALANATAAERAQVEDLIRVKLKEEAAQKQAKEAWDFAKSSAYDALEALIIQGDKASDVMANLASQIAKAFLQSALLGTGPLAGLFGGSGGGLFGGLGSLLGGGDLFANIGGLAEGGDVVGPGGPRDDAVLSWLSNGEYVVNADATARHRPLLEAINRAPRFATGGGVGSGSYFPAFAPSGVTNVNSPGNWSGRSGGESREPMVLELRLTDDLDARIASTSERVSVKVVRAGFKEHNAKELPRLVQAINRDPRKVG